MHLYRVYDVGVDVRFGEGRFHDTRIVTFAPRYQFENRSSHNLAFQQRHFVREQVLRLFYDEICSFVHCFYTVLANLAYVGNE